jgi:hypothetical protein
MSYEVYPDLSGKFNKLLMNAEASEQALKVSPLFLAYLQNKIAEYASAVVESKLPYDPDPSRQVAAILEHERLRNFCAAYEELMAELTQASSNQPE